MTYQSELQIQFDAFMQICMIMTSKAKATFVADLKKYMDDHGVGVSEIARICGVHQGQVSRIVAGNFKTLSSNVIKICMALGIDVGKYRFEAGYDDLRLKLAEDAFSIWDGTPEDAVAVGALLRDIARLRRRPPSER